MLKSVLFYCTGNSCRSQIRTQLGEFFRQQLKQVQGNL
jgi:protein-tyrosine-phosphatase